MIDRRKFIKLVAGGLLVSQWPGAIFAASGQAAPTPEPETIQTQGHFEFDLTDHRLRFSLLSLDGTGMQAIQYQCATNPNFELLPCAEGDGYLAPMDAIHNLPARNPPLNVIDHFILYIIAQGCAENLLPLAILADEAKSVSSFIVALIVETDDTDPALWSAMAADAGIDGLCWISPAGMGPVDEALAPHFPHHPLELTCLAALRAHTDLVWHDGLIGIDVADYETIVKRQGPGRIGIGHAFRAAKGKDTPEIAATMALERLIEQCVELGQAQAFWVTIYCGNDATMEDFDGVCRVIHKDADPDADVIIGLFLAEEFSERVAVTVIAG